MFINDVLTWGGGPPPPPTIYAYKGGGEAENDMLTRGRGGQDIPQKWWRHLWTAPYAS